MAVADGLVDEAAHAIGMDVVDIRRKNLIPDDAYPMTTATGMKLDDLSHHKSLDKLIEVMG